MRAASICIAVRRGLLKCTRAFTYFPLLPYYTSIYIHKAAEIHIVRCKKCIKVSSLISAGVEWAPSGWAYDRTNKLFPSRLTQKNIHTFMSSIFSPSGGVFLLHLYMIFVRRAR